MTRKQLAALFACALIGWTVGQGTLSLLPVYAIRLGADPATVGNFLALAFGALTVGTVAAGWLSDKFQRRKLMLIVFGLVSAPASWLMGYVGPLWQLAALTAIVWFSFGASLTVINILVGLFASETERGKMFGIIAINTSLGALIGGAVSGRVADQWGYAAWFLLAALCWALQPFITLLLEDKVVEAQGEAAVSASNPTFGTAFYLLLLANVVAFACNFASALGRPLLMDSLSFDATAISGVIAVSGALSLPFPVLAGWLSDRVGRYGLIALCFLISAAGLVTLAASQSLWHFWVSGVLLGSLGVSLAVGPALMTDLVPPAALGKALAWYGFAPSTGGIIGFAVTGYAIQSFGPNATFIGAAILTLIAILLLLQVQRIQQRVLNVRPASDKCVL